MKKNCQKNKCHEFSVAFLLFTFAFFIFTIMLYLWNPDNLIISNDDKFEVNELPSLNINTN